MDEKAIEEARLIADSLTNVKHHMITVYTIRDLCNRLEKAQRPWVGLTWDDLPETAVGDVGFMQGAKWAEAKLKEKNHG